MSITVIDSPASFEAIGNGAVWDVVVSSGVALKYSVYYRRGIELPYENIHEGVAAKLSGYDYFRLDLTEAIKQMFYGEFMSNSTSALQDIDLGFSGMYILRLVELDSMGAEISSTNTSEKTVYNTNWDGYDPLDYYITLSTIEAKFLTDSPDGQLVRINDRIHLGYLANFLSGSLGINMPILVDRYTTSGVGATLNYFPNFVRNVYFWNWYLDGEDVVTGIRNVNVAGVTITANHNLLHLADSNNKMWGAIQLNANAEYIQTYSPFQFKTPLTSLNFGYQIKVKVYARSVGSPGNITCYYFFPSSFRLAGTSAVSTTGAVYTFTITTATTSQQNLISWFRVTNTGTVPLQVFYAYAEINSIHSSKFTGGFTLAPGVFLSDTQRVEIYFSLGGSRKSQKRTYYLDTNTCEYNRFSWINRFGKVDSFNFYFLEGQSMEVEKLQFFTDLKQTKILNTKVNYVFSCYADTEQGDWLKGILESKKVILEIGTAQYPVDILTNTFEYVSESIPKLRLDWKFANL